MNIYQLPTKIFLAFLILGLVRVFIPPPPPHPNKKNRDESLVLFDDQYATAPTFYNPRPKNSENVIE
jgi:hypothetical protein